jgi:16S rRNA (guanine1516-N2)-methyltransferase
MTAYMAYLGAQIQLVERHPILFTLLEDSKAQAQRDPFLSQFMDRIQLIFADSASYLKQLDQEEKQLMWSILTRCSHSAIKINKQLKNKPKSKSKCSFCICFT